MNTIRCPHCQKDFEVDFPTSAELRIRLIDVQWGGLEMPDFIKWLKGKLLIK